MDYKTMEVAALEERLSQIVEEATEERTLEELQAYEEEQRAIKAELESRKAAEAERREKAEAIARGKAKKVIDKNEEERKMPDIKEIRSSKDYLDAFANYIKTGNDAECRALLTDNATGGTVPVPEIVYGIVADRVKASPILSRVRRMEVKGNVKVGFEADAPEAEFHAEGGAAIGEEALVLGIVTMVPGAMKKWVQFSDEVMDNSEAFVRYIYDELTRGIIKAREKAVIQAILAAPQTATATAPAVAKTGAAPGAITDIVNARALLSAAAEDIVVIMSPALYAQYRGYQMAATYAVDPFDGREVIISEYATAPIVGDLAGAMENLPNGDDIQFKLDDTTLMTSDMVRLLGRQAVATAVVGNLFFAKVAA